MRPLIMLPLVAALSVTLAPSAWADPCNVSCVEREQHWVKEIRHRLDAGFRAPEMSYRNARLTADVRFDIDQDGGIRNPTLMSSSGSEEMDQAVLAAVTTAGALPAPPPSLRGSKVVFRGSVDATRRVGPQH